MSRILFTGGEYLGRYTPWAGSTPLGKYTAHLAGTLPRQVPPGRYTPQQVHPPGRYTPPNSACWEIRATSRHYASYWNAFLLNKFKQVSSDDHQMSVAGVGGRYPGPISGGRYSEVQCIMGVMVTWDRQTDACEKITFPKFRLRAVTKCYVM